VRWGGASSIQLTHSLKATGFNPRTYQGRHCFQNLLSKCNLLHRYSAAAGQAAAAAAAAVDRSWRWSAVNTAFACALTAVGAVFTFAQLRALTRAHDASAEEEEERKRARRLLLVRERAALRRVET
jgi:hypothetical protein